MGKTKNIKGRKRDNILIGRLQYGQVIVEYVSQYFFWSE